MVASQPSLLQVLIHPILQYEPVGERPRLRAELDANSDSGTTMEVDVALRLMVLQHWLRRDPRISTVYVMDIGILTTVKYPYMLTKTCLS